MSSSTNRRGNGQAKPRSMLYRFFGGSIKLLLSAAVVVGGILIYQYQMRTSPQAARKRPATQAKLIEVIPVRQEDCVTTVTAMGTAAPAQRVVLRPQVAGKIVELSTEVIPGGVVREGQRLVSIDHRDYEVLVQQRRGDVAKALEYLKVEQGNQAIAKQQYELLGEVVTEQDRELVLRQPQLASAQSALASAEAALQKAELDLARCDVNAPFNAIIQDKHVDVGAVVGLNSDMVTLVGTDEAWIEVMVRVDQLKWLDIPQRNGNTGSTVTIHNDKVWGADRFRTGRVVRLTGELETQARWARLLVAADDPFCLEPENQGLPQLLIGTYVRVEIQGHLLEDVYPVDRSYLRGNTVWIMDEKGRLEIRAVEVVFRRPERVFVGKGLRDGEKLIVTDLGAPVAGMPLRIDGGGGRKGSQDHSMSRGAGR